MDTYCYTDIPHDVLMIAYQFMSPFDMVRASRVTKAIYMLSHTTKTMNNVYGTLDVPGREDDVEAYVKKYYKRRYPNGIIRTDSLSFVHSDFMRVYILGSIGMNKVFVVKDNSKIITSSGGNMIKISLSDDRETYEVVDLFTKGITSISGQDIVPLLMNTNEAKGFNITRITDTVNSNLNATTLLSSMFSAKDISDMRLTASRSIQKVLSSITGTNMGKQSVSNYIKDMRTLYLRNFVHLHRMAVEIAFIVKAVML